MRRPGVEPATCWLQLQRPNAFNHYQWCKQDQILKTKTKIIRPRPPEVNKGTWRISLLSKWTPQLISTVVMFQAQNTETINSIWKVAVSFKIIMTTSVKDHVSQNNTRSARSRPQCARPRPRPRPIFFVSDWSCSKTDGLRPYHWLPSRSLLC